MKSNDINFKSPTQQLTDLLTGIILAVGTLLYLLQPVGQFSPF